MANRIFQDLSSFVMPPNFRGRGVIFVQFWWIVQSLIFRNSPQYLYKFRAFLLRCFGAKIGKNVLIRPTVKVTYPWKLRIGDCSWIGDDVVLYSLGIIDIGDHSVISQRSYLCAGDHDYQISSFPIRGRNIVVESEVWVATDVYISPGVVIGRGAVVGARSSVFSDLPGGWVCVGSPCKAVKLR